MMQSGLLDETALDWLLPLHLFSSAIKPSPSSEK